MYILWRIRSKTAILLPLVISQRRITIIFIVTSPLVNQHVRPLQGPPRNCFCFYFRSSRYPGPATPGRVGPCRLGSPPQLGPGLCPNKFAPAAGSCGWSGFGCSAKAETDPPGGECGFRKSSAEWLVVVRRQSRPGDLRLGALSRPRRPLGTSKCSCACRQSLRGQPGR